MMKIDFLPTKKFKNTLITLRLIAPYEADTINYRSILPQVLASSTDKYRNKSALSRHLDGLYGTQMSVFTAKVGLESAIHFQLLFPSDRFLPNQESVSEKVVDLLKQILFYPKTNQGIFTKRAVEEEIRLLKEAIEAEYNDKSEYAFQQFKKIMFENERYSFRSKGIYERLNEITPESLWQYYLNVLKNDTLHLSVVGDFNQTHLERLLSQTFNGVFKENPHHWIDDETKIISQVRRIQEFNDLKQAKLFIGYRTNVRFDSEKYLSMMVLNILLGDSDQAKLFRIIREEHHLCYSIGSTYDSNKGIIIVSMGIEPENENKAVDLAVEVIQSLKKGIISDDELAFAKAFQIKRIRQRDDSILSLSASDFYYRKVYGTTYDTHKLVEMIDSVSKEDIIACAESLILDTIYVLTKKDNQ